MNDGLEAAARVYDEAAKELELAARHCEVAAQHFRDGVVPGGAAPHGPRAVTCSRRKLVSASKRASTLRSVPEA